MTASQSKTVWTLGIVGILAFLAYKLWPSIRKAINESSGGGSAGSGTGVGSGSAESPYGDEGQGSGQSSGLGSLGASLGLGTGSGAGASGLGGAEQQVTDPLGALWNWISSSESNEPDMSSDLGSNSATGYDELAAADVAGLPTASTSNFDVNQLAYSAGDAAGYDSGAGGDGYGGDAGGGGYGDGSDGDGYSDGDGGDGGDTSEGGDPGDD